MADATDSGADGADLQGFPAVEVRLTVVTLAKNNPADVWRTLRSLSLQNHGQCERLVVDSSEPESAAHIREFAEAFGADYVWIPGRGIYPAMRYSLWLLAPDSYVWWLNSSDWLAGPDAIANARRHIFGSLQLPGQRWIVGQLVRVGNGQYELHQFDPKPDNFVAQLMSGNGGFAHPSSIFHCGSLQQIAPFESDLRIAGDFAAAIEFGHRFGPPHIAREILSVHEVNGLTSRHPYRSFVEKSFVRWRFGNWRNRLREPFAFLVYGLLAIVARFMVGPIRGPLQASDLLGLPGLEHFCQTKDFQQWPQCCQHALDDGFPLNSPSASSV